MTATESPPQRIVVKETVYWQARGSAPKSVPGSFVRLVMTEELPYFRPGLKVGEEWQPLDIGWLKASCMVVLENLTEVRKTIPTPEQLVAARAKILEVAVAGAEDTYPVCHVPVGECFRFTPSMGDVSKLRIRCLKGETKVNVSAFPAGGASGG